MMRKFNHGKRWSEEDLFDLMLHWRLSDANLLVMCQELGRGSSAVCSKLRDVGILSFDQPSLTYTRNKARTVYATYAEIKAVDRYMDSNDLNAEWSEFFQVQPSWKRK